ncbi:MAG TPA: hypothetical protein VHB72_01680 [Candidatus Saccharimonadales bacterium]|nr:hypothetical protein [Candidatus Saccharimonadales bacterium]
MLFYSSMASPVDALPNPRTLEFTQTLFRPANSPALETLFGRLALYEASDGRFQRPSSPDGEVGTRLILAKNRELRENAGRLMQLGLEGQPLFGRLIDKMPILSEPRTVTADCVHHHISKRGEHYVDLSLLREDIFSTKNERYNLWRALEELSGEELAWRPHMPKLRVAYMGNKPQRVGEWMLRPVIEEIEAMLPMEITLDPLHDPN